MLYYNNLVCHILLLVDISLIVMFVTSLYISQNKLPYKYQIKKQR